MSDLAMFGGPPVIPSPLAPYESLGKKEQDALIAVVESGSLSGFYGSPGDEFFGGAQVQAFEAAWCERFGVNHTISVNSNTSGLLAALGAIGLCPGDEVIIPPTTMSATAITPLFWGGIPVFADIEEETFCIDPSKVLSEITERTKAIVAVNLFGHPARLGELRKIADDHGLFLIEDNAQAPLGYEDGIPCGTIGDIGVFSLNYHKHIHTGEGGMCTTNDKTLAQRMALIRNHGENVHEWLGIDNPANVIGLNLRQTEMGAAVGLVQLEDIDLHVTRREKIAEGLSATVSDMSGITPPIVRENCRHNYYCWVMKINSREVGVSRDIFSKALEAEGFPNTPAYLAPLYLLPVFQKRMAIGMSGWPFTSAHRTYEKGLCPVAERLHEEEIIFFEPCAWAVDDETLEQLQQAFVKVFENRRDLSNAPS